jgi:hypothetical protein
VAISLLALALGGCASGDFGRTRADMRSDDMHRWVGEEATASVGITASQFQLTDDERQLRDYAYPLIEPPYDRHRWYSVLNEWGMTYYFRPEWYRCDPTAYAARLMTAYVRSETARYFRLNEDIRNDVGRIQPFFAVARRVLEMDNKRDQTLPSVAVLSAQEVANAKARIGENYLVVAWVQKSLADRAESYRFALERLFVAVPSPPAVEVERSLTLLRTRIAENNIVTPPPDLAVVTAAVPLPPPGRAVVSK